MMKILMSMVALSVAGLSFLSLKAKPIADTSDLETSDNTKIVALSLHGKTIQTPVYKEFRLIDKVFRNKDNLIFAPSSLFTGKYSQNALTLRSSPLTREILAVSDEAIDTSCKGIAHRNSTGTLCYKVSRIENASRLNPTHQYDGVVTINDAQYEFIILGHPTPSQSIMILTNFADD